MVFATLSQSGHETLSGNSLSGKAGRDKRSLHSGRVAQSGERFDAVVIDEAVELAKRFSTDDSGRFVNGVLSALVPVLRPPS